MGRGKGAEKVREEGRKTVIKCEEGHQTSIKD